MGYSLTSNAKLLGKNDTVNNFFLSLENYIKKINHVIEFLWLLVKIFHTYVCEKTFKNNLSVNTIL